MFCSSLQSVVLFDAESLRCNKVSVFVPYSTLLRNKRDHPRVERETSVDIDEEIETETETGTGKQKLQNCENENEVEEDNVFICGDTQVILRINSLEEKSQKNEIISRRPLANETDRSLVRDETWSGRSLERRSKIYSKRMTKRLICAAPSVRMQLTCNKHFTVVRRFDSKLIKGYAR